MRSLGSALAFILQNRMVHAAKRIAFAFLATGVGVRGGKPCREVLATDFATSRGFMNLCLMYSVG